MTTKPGAGWASSAVFQLGKGKTLAVPMEVHATARQKVVDTFKSTSVVDGVLLLKGGEEKSQYDTDTDALFRQDSWFNYLFGVKESGVYGAISIHTGKSVLFIPKLDDSYRIWCGEIFPPSHFKLSYAVDEVLYVENLGEWLEKELSVSTTAKLHVMMGVNSDSLKSPEPMKFNDIESFSAKLESAVAYNIVAHCRVTKSPQEQEVMEYCAWVASNAHVEVMRHAKNCEFEYELEAKFLYEIYRRGGCRRCAYTSICACGPNAAVLHYGHAGAPNERQLSPANIALLDMGAEYHGYVSDITCSFPLSGTFSADQKIVYGAVLAAQKAVYKIMRPGTVWADCHRAAEREIVRALLAAGLLHNGSEDEIIAAGVGGVFFPHGLGHLIGCDTHDVGGYLPGAPERLPGPGLSKLRTARVLEANMVLTNEPGCYFIDALIDSALADPARGQFINADAVARFRGFGGVRIEDVVVVTEAGPVNITTCPRTFGEIESVMAGGQWPPAVDTAPELKRKWSKLAPQGHGMIANEAVKVSRCNCEVCACGENCKCTEASCCTKNASGGCCAAGCICGPNCQCGDNCQCGSADRAAKTGCKSNPSCPCGAACGCGDNCTCGK